MMIKEKAREKRRRKSTAPLRLRLNRRDYLFFRKCNFGYIWSYVN